MDIEGTNILVLGGAGMVGTAVCRRLLDFGPARIAVAARREFKARTAVEQLQAELPHTSTRILPVWGDVFLRADWQPGGAPSRTEILADRARRRRLLADILEPLDEDMVAASFLTRLIDGSARGLDGKPAWAVIDCMNTATAVSYQNIFSAALRLAALAAESAGNTDWPEEVETLLASLYVPQMVRHVQILYEAMKQAGTQAYIKVGTSGTGGMGLNIPYTHGEEKPSRLLLSKASMAGAQSMLTFLLARTPGGPPLVKEIKPTACIGWHEIGYGPIDRRGSSVMLYDCPPEQAASVHDPASLEAEGTFGRRVGRQLEAVYIDTGENGRFSAAEFTALTAPGQMQMVTTEEVAENLVRELLGYSTGHDIVAALDASVIGPSYRAASLRDAALNRLRQLEADHGEAVAFEILGPPRLSKLLYEAYLLKRSVGTLDAVLTATSAELAARLEQTIRDDEGLRRRIISIGIPILLADGERLLRGPRIKSADAYHGWVDLTPANLDIWQKRLQAMSETLRTELHSDSSSRSERSFTASRKWHAEKGFFDIGEIAAWIMTYEEQGGRGKG
ncbi:MAG: polysaccharide biosynthesis protein [Pseudomonadota bacterium]|nr:polysaccharide biosynthesis protein [Pseudomonadota bacterium]